MTIRAIAAASAAVFAAFRVPYREKQRQPDYYGYYRYQDVIERFHTNKLPNCQTIRAKT